MDNRPIGILDSGVGGMTVLNQITKLLPYEEYIYLGDTKRFPYGSKSKETIIELTKESIEFLIKKNVKVIVIACGTATSQALEEVQNMYDIPIIGVLEPTAKYLKQKQIKNIGVMATAGTIKSKGWENAILKEMPNASIQSIACPLLAQMVEEGWYNNKIASLTVKEYLKSLKRVDALVLGCTHYPLLTQIIKKQVGKKVEIINTGIFVAQELKEILEKENMLSENKSEKQEIYLTEIEPKFSEIASILFEHTVIPKQVEEQTQFK